MSKTANEAWHFRAQFRTQSGWKVRASFNRKADGRWSIFSIGGVGVPTALMPFHLAALPGQTFDTLHEAKLAVKAA